VETDFQIFDREVY
jgi:hypothetical protein